MFLSRGHLYLEKMEPRFQTDEEMITTDPSLRFSDHLSVIMIVLSSSRPLENGLSRYLTCSSSTFPVRDIVNTITFFIPFSLAFLTMLSACLNDATMTAVSSLHSASSGEKT